MVEEKLYTIQVTDMLTREIKVSARDDADAIVMTKELLDNERVRMSRTYDLINEKIEIKGVAK